MFANHPETDLKTPEGRAVSPSRPRLFLVGVGEKIRDFEAEKRDNRAFVPTEEENTQDDGNISNGLFLKIRGVPPAPSPSGLNNLSANYPSHELKQVR